MLYTLRYVVLYFQLLLLTLIFHHLYTIIFTYQIRIEFDNIYESKI